MTISVHKPVRASVIRDGHFLLVPFETLASGAVSVKGIPPIVRWSFLLFVFTIPFEGADVGFTSSSASLSKFSGLLFFMCFFFYYNPLLSHLSHIRPFPHSPHAMWWFLGYIAVYTLQALLIPEIFMSSFFSSLLSRVQLIFLFWIASSLLGEAKIARQVVLTFVFASTTMAFGILLNLPGFAGSTAMQDSIKRVTMQGYNANAVGKLLALTVVMLIGLRLNAAFKHFWSKLSLLALGLPLVVCLVKTGSRGAMALTMIGFSVYLLPLCRSHRKGTAFILAILGMVAVVYTVLRSPIALSRWQQTYYEGRLSGRERLIPATVGMILERPIFGWQPVAYMFELRKRVAGEGPGGMDPHNLYLYLFVEVGMVGAVPFLVGLWLCGRAAWKARVGSLGLMPLALLLATLASNMSSTEIQRKPLWIVLALTQAGASIAAREQRKGGGRLLVRRPLRSGS